MISNLEILREKSKILDQRFFELNKGFLHDVELHEQNKNRNIDLNNLYKRLIKMRE